MWDFGRWAIERESYQKQTNKQTELRFISDQPDRRKGSAAKGEMQMKLWKLKLEPGVTMLLHTPTYFVYPLVLDFFLLAQSSALNYDPFGQHPNSLPGSSSPFPLSPVPLNSGWAEVRIKRTLQLRILSLSDIKSGIAWKHFPSYRVTSLKHQHGSKPTVLKWYPCLWVSRQMGWTEANITLVGRARDQAVPFKVR